MPGTQGATVFGLLGELVVAVDGEPREVPGDKVRLLLAMLAAEPGRVVGTDTLVEELWRTPSADDAGRLQAVVSRARRALAGGCAIEFRSGGYVLGASTDVQRAAELSRLGTEAATAGEFGVAEGHLRAALALRRGPAYAEFADREFFRVEAARVDEAHLHLTERLAAVLLAADRPAEAVAVLEPHVGAHPFREEAAAHLMTALHRCGRRADSLAVYRAVRERMADELGLDPGPELKRVEALVLAASPELDLVVPDGSLSYRPRDDKDRYGMSSVSEGSPAHNLPNLGGRFVGRAAELAELGELLETQRLVTVWGPGGAGKTRLAVEAAGRSIDDFPDGVWFAALAGVGSPDQVAPAVMSAFGMLGATERDPITTLTDNLTSRQALLVLDNCEHLLDGAARVAHALLTTCPHVRVLATSREPLLVPDEYVWPALSLVLPPPGADLDAVRACDAGALFLDRVRLAAPGFAPAQDTAPVVAEICRRLDGIPLALELAAARVRALGLQGVADRLDDQFALLTGGHRTADSRHRTMRAAIEWSLDLASAAERDMLSCLAVFPGSFDLEAAHAVSGGAELGATTDVLAHLVDRSLLTVADPGPVRYRLLEPIRQHCAEGPTHRDRVPEIRARHVAHFAAQARRWNRWFDGGAEWVAWRADAQNYRAAVQWALAARDAAAAARLTSLLYAYWAFEDNPEDSPHDWLVGARALAGARDDAYTANVMSMQALSDGDLATAERAVALAKDCGSLHAQAAAAWVAANVVARSDPRLGRDRLLDALGAATAAGDAGTGMLRSCRLSLAYVELALGNPSAAREHSEILVADVSDGHTLAAMTLGCHTLVLALNGEHELAEFTAQRAIATARSADLAGLQALALLRAATVASLAERWILAVERLVELVVLLRRLSTQRWVSDTLHIAAIALANLDRQTYVVQLLDAAQMQGRIDETPGGTLPFVAAAAARAREIAVGATPGAAPLDLANRDAILRLALDELRAVAEDAG